MPKNGQQVNSASCGQWMGECPERCIPQLFPLRPPLVKIKRTEAAKKYPLPFKAYADDTCHDLVTVEDTEINNHTLTNVPTGIALQIPPGWCVKIHPRSSAPKRNILVIPAVVDRGYTGELFVRAMLINGNESLTIKAGERIAQFELTRVVDVEFQEVDELDPSERGEKCLGSSGL